MNEDFRRRVFTPILLPLSVLGVVLAIALAFSRVLLAVPEIISTFSALLLAAYIMGVAALVAAKPKISTRALGSGLAVGMIGILLAGVAGASSGTRPLEEHGEGEGGAGEEAGPPPNTWIAIDVLFEAAPMEVATGTEITLENLGQAPHNLTIDEAGGVVIDAAPGATGTAMLDLAPGTYRYYCSVPGHENTMNGMLTVTG